MDELELLELELDELELLLELELLEELDGRPDELELDDEELELLEELLVEEPPLQRVAVALRPLAVLCSSK